MRWPFAAISLGYIVAAIRSLTAIGKDDSISLIVELLSARACPAGMLLLLQLAAAGSLAASGVALSLAQVPQPSAQRALQFGLASHAAANLFDRRDSKSLPLLSRAQSPRALHLASLSVCLGDSVVSRLTAARSSSGPVPPAPPPMAFLLDIDGTLVQTDDLYFEAFKELLQPVGVAVDEAWYAENVHGKTDKQVFEFLFPEADADEILAWGHKKDAKFCELYRRKCAKSGPPVVPGLAMALEAAQQRGVRAIAVTNAPRGAAEACIDSLRAAIPAASIIHPTIIIGAECTQAKPHPEPYLVGARTLGVAPADCVVFEDSGSGVRAGIAAGARAVVGLCTNLDAAALQGLGASRALADWNGLTAEVLDTLETTRPPSLGAAADKPSTARALAKAAARHAVSLPPPMALAVGLLMSARPAVCVQRTLFCDGEARIPTAATRATGGALVVLAAMSHAWMSASMNACGGSSGQAAGDGAARSQAAQGALACGIVASSAVHLRALLKDGHAVSEWARMLLLLSVPTCGAAVGLASAGRRCSMSAA